MSTLIVKFAVYGALAGGNENQSQAIDVTKALQTAIDNNQGIVRIDSTNMGKDPSVGNGKHFAAIVAQDGENHYFACDEGQTIDFYHWIPPSD
jgi:hypothetical protein